MMCIYFLLKLIGIRGCSLSTFEADARCLYIGVACTNKKREKENLLMCIIKKHWVYEPEREGNF